MARKAAEELKSPELKNKVQTVKKSLLEQQHIKQREVTTNSSTVPARSRNQDDCSEGRRRIEKVEKPQLRQTAKEVPEREAKARSFSITNTISIMSALKKNKNVVAIVKNCTTIGLRLTRFRCTRFSRLKVSGKPDAESLGTNSNGTIHPVRATSCEYL